MLKKSGTDHLLDESVVGSIHAGAQRIKALAVAVIRWVSSWSQNPVLQLQKAMAHVSAHQPSKQFSDITLLNNTSKSVCMFVFSWKYSIFLNLIFKQYKVSLLKSHQSNTDFLECVLTFQPRSLKLTYSSCFLHGWPPLLAGLRP